MGYSYGVLVLYEVALSRRKHTTRERGRGSAIGCTLPFFFFGRHPRVCLVAFAKGLGVCGPTCEHMQGRRTCNLRLSSAAVIIPRSHHSSQPSLLAARSTNSPCSVTHVIRAAICFVLHHLLISVSACCSHAHINYRPIRPKLASRSFACSMNADWDDSENRTHVGEHECIGEFPSICPKQ